MSYYGLVGVRAQIPHCAVWLDGVRSTQVWYCAVCQQTYALALALLKCDTLEP